MIITVTSNNWFLLFWWHCGVNFTYVPEITYYVSGVGWARNN